MRKVWVIASREYAATVQTKAFLIGLLIVPILMGGSIVMQRLLEGFKDTKDLHFVVVDRTNDSQLVAALHAAIDQYNASQLNDPKTGKQVQPKLDVTEKHLESDSDETVDAAREELSEKVRKGDLFGFLEIGPDVEKPKPLDAEKAKEYRGLRYQSNRPTHQTFPRVAEATITATLQARRGRPCRGGWNDADPRP